MGAATFVMGGNMGLIYREAFSGKTQASGAFTIDVDGTANRHQISAEGDGTQNAGTLAIEVRDIDCTGWTVAEDSAGNPLTLDLTTTDVVVLDGVYISGIRLTPTAYDGATYSGGVKGWAD